MFLTFKDQDGNSSVEKKITNFWKNDFHKGKTQKFSIELAGISKVTEIRIRRDQTGEDDGW